MNQNLFKQAAILMKNNIMVIQPLFFWIVVMMVVVAPLSAKKSVDISFIVTAIIAVLCFTAFLAGWYNCVKYTVSIKNKTNLTPEENNKEQIEILKNFFPGVGEYIVPVTIVAIMYGIFAYATLEAYRYIYINTPIIQNLPQDFIKVINTGTQAEITQYLQTNFTEAQLQTLLIFLIGSFVVYILFNTLVLWFAPAIYYTSKNPFVAIINAIKFTFTNIKVSFSIIFVMFFLNLMISMSNILLGNKFLAFIPMLLYFLYIMFYVLTVFLYYETKTQDNRNSGSECIGEV